MCEALPEAEGLADHVTPSKALLGDGAMRLKDELDGLLKVRAGVIERRALRVGARKLLDVGDEPLGNTLEHRR